MNEFHSVIRDLRRDLELLDDRIRWAFADGYWPKAPNPGRPSALRLDPPPAVDPDHVPGRRLDIGIAEYASREAFKVSVRMIRIADLQLVFAVAELDPRPPQPTVIEIEVGSPLSLIVETVARARARVELVAAGYPDTPAPARRSIRSRLYGARATPRSVRDALDVAVRQLSGALDRADQPGAPRSVSAPLCSNCQADEAHPRKGGRCDACDAYWHRNGIERPERLWSRGVAVARAAQARARARGEGWGMA